MHKIGKHYEVTYYIRSTEMKSQPHLHKIRHAESDATPFRLKGNSRRFFFSFDLRWYISQSHCIQIWRIYSGNEEE